MVKHPPSNAGDGAVIPGRRTKFPHALGQLSWHAAAREASAPLLLTPALESPSTKTREKPTCQNKDQCSQKTRKDTGAEVSHWPPILAWGWGVVTARGLGPPSGLLWEPRRGWGAWPWPLQHHSCPELCHRQEGLGTPTPGWADPPLLPSACT